MTELIDFQIGTPIVEKFPVPPGDKNVRVTFTEEAWREWQFYVHRAPGEISVLAEVLELETDDCFTFVIPKVHIMKQRNTRADTDMDELATNQFYTQMEIDGKLATAYCWIHSHFTFDCFVSGKDAHNIQRWFDSGGKRLLTVITNQRGSFFAKFSWRDDSSPTINHRIISELTFENPWKPLEEQWKKKMDELCVFDVNSMASEFGSEQPRQMRRFATHPGTFQQDDTYHDDRSVARQINRYEQAHRRERGRVTEKTVELSSELARVRDKIAELNDALETIPFGTERYNSLATELFAAEVELNDLNKKHFQSMFANPLEV